MFPSPAFVGAIVSVSQPLFTSPAVCPAVGSSFLGIGTRCSPRQKNGSFVHAGARAMTMSGGSSEAAATARSGIAPATEGGAEGPEFAALFDNPEDANVYTGDGTTESLIDFVSGQNVIGKAVVLGWLRHFGCTLCMKQASDWRDWLPELSKLGDVTVALVGNGPPNQAIDFKDEVQWPSHIFTDPQRKSYSALSFKKNLLSTLNAAAFVKVVKSLASGFKQTLTRLPTDPFQQGGVVIVDHKGVVSFFHTDRFAGDHVDKETLFEAVRKATSVL